METMENCSVFVTGAAGFIGSNLCRNLLKLGYNITAIDDMSCGFYENIEDLMKKYSRKRFDFYETSVTEYHRKSNRAVFYNLRRKNVDVLIHLAARGETYWSETNPTKAVEINVNGTVKMLELAKDIGVKHFIFTDTSAEYDNIFNGYAFKYNELCAPNFESPFGIYSITKMAASQFVRSYANKHKILATIVRPFNIYGPGMNTERDIPPVIGSFIKCAFENKSPVIYGDGTKRRDFLYISDAVSLFTKIIEKRKYNKETKYDITINMGSGTNFSINHVDRIIRYYMSKMFGIEYPETIYVDNKTYEAKTTLSDNNFVESYFDWVPRVKFSEGVLLTILIMRKMLEEEK